MSQSTPLSTNPLVILAHQFEGCDDFRSSNMIKYTLAEILFLVFCGMLSGSEDYDEIFDFGGSRLSWLRKYLPYENGIPSGDTIGRVLSYLNTRQLERILIDYSSYDIELPDGNVLHIDGKWLRGSATKKEKQTKKSKGGKQAVHMVNVYCSSIHQCLASFRVASKSGERSALSDILNLLEVSQSLLTMDAIYCHKEVVEQVIEAEADYLIGLKSNQPKLLAAAQDLLARCPAVETHIDQKEEGHGRIEQRTCKVLNFSNLDEEYKEEYGALFSEWMGLKCLIMVTCFRLVKSNNKKSNESRFYISSQEQMPKKANQNVRQHWQVENNLHWVLDVSFGEDDSKIRKGNAAQNVSIIRKIAFNKLKAFDDPKVSMKRKMKKCNRDCEYLEAVVQAI